MCSYIEPTDARSSFKTFLSSNMMAQFKYPLPKLSKKNMV